MLKKPITIILGPTGIGKSDLAIQWAEKYNAQIISADAYQVYKGMDIGTGKIDTDSRKKIPHHLIDIKDPKDSYNVAEFLKQTHAIINQYYDKVPIIICGGTGFYIHAFLYDYQLDASLSSETIREQLHTELQQHGPEHLLNRLRTIDPNSEKTISLKDHKRIIRTLEIHEIKKQTHTTPIRQQRSTPRKDTQLIGLSAPKHQRHDRINQRVLNMISAGLIDEVQQLLKQGVPKTAQSMEALGYKQVIAYLDGSLSYQEMIHLIQLKTRQFAKRQMTWFRRYEHIEWIIQA